MTLTEPRFVCDETGNKVAVVLPIDLYEEFVELLEQHDDLKAIEEAMQDAERIPWEQVKTELGVPRCASVYRVDFVTVIRVRHRRHVYR